MNRHNITSFLLEKIEKAINDFSLLEGAGGILVGLSGGADSTCLLVSLKQLQKKYGYRLCALHVNHMIRGNEADRDEEFSRKLCEKYEVEFVCERVDVPLLSAEKGESLELCARNVRYEIFSRVAKEKGLTHIATAHNACDNAETVVFNLVRGTGIRGLCGIPPKRSFEGVTVIRPLIYAERSEIETHLEEIGQSYVTDSTNSDTDYTRNYIRREILPSLRRINPSVEQALGRTSSLLSSDEDFLQKFAAENNTDDIVYLKTLDKSILSRVVIQRFSKVCGETPTAFHIEELVEKIYAYSGKTLKVSFPGCMSALISGGRLSFRKDERKKRREKIEFCVEIGEGSTFFEENPYALFISFDGNKDIPQTLENDEIVYKKYTTDYLYFDTIPNVLFARNRCDGDKILSGRIHKSVKRILNDSHFCEEERYLVPFITDGEKVLLVPSVLANDECKNDGKREKTVCVTLYKKENKE